MVRDRDQIRLIDKRQEKREERVEKVERIDVDSMTDKQKQARDGVVLPFERGQVEIHRNYGDDSDVSTDPDDDLDI